MIKSQNRPTAPSQRAGPSTGSKPPVLDFDNNTLLAPIHLVSLMCSRTPQERNLIEAAISIETMAITDTMPDTAPGVPLLMDRIIALSDSPNPDISTYEKIMLSYSRTASGWPAMESFFDHLSVLCRLRTGDEMSSFDALMRICRHPEVREILRSASKETFDFVESQLFRPAGGFRAASKAPSTETVVGQIAHQCQGPAMLAGLVLTVVARMKFNYPEINVSLRRAYFVLERPGAVPAGKTKIQAAWADWKRWAPLWAGLIAENGYRDLSVDALFGITNNKWRRKKVIAFARWFANECHSPSTGEPLLPVSEVVSFDCAIKARKPPLPPLDGSDLAHASKYSDQLRNEKMSSKK